MATLELTVLVHEPMGLAVPVPRGWSVRLDDAGDALAAVAGDDLGNDLLNPSITVERQGAACPWSQLEKLADASLDEMRLLYKEFTLHWTRELPETERVIRAYSYTHDELGPIGQVQALVVAGGLVMVNCTAPAETFDELASTFERITSSIDVVDLDDVVEEPDVEEPDVDDD